MSTHTCPLLAAAAQSASRALQPRPMAPRMAVPAEIGQPATILHVFNGAGDYVLPPGNKR